MKNEHSLKESDFILDEIVSIECIGDRDTIDITVEDTNMFFVNGIYSHNSAHKEDILGADSVADSYRKIMTGDVVMSISRKVEDKISSVARIHMIKDRFGPDGMTWPTSFNASNGDIRIYEANSKEGIEIQQKMDSDSNSVKDVMRDSWNKIKKTKDLDDFDD